MERQTERLWTRDRTLRGRWLGWTRARAATVRRDPTPPEEKEAEKGGAPESAPVSFSILRLSTGSGLVHPSTYNSSVLTEQKKLFIVTDFGLRLSLSRSQRLPENGTSFRDLAHQPRSKKKNGCAGRRGLKPIACRTSASHSLESSFNPRLCKRQYRKPSLHFQFSSSQACCGRRRPAPKWGLIRLR